MVKLGLVNVFGGQMGLLFDSGGPDALMLTIRVIWVLDLGYLVRLW